MLYQVDVTIGKMLIMGTLFHQIDAVLSLAAALSVQTPYTNWAHRDADCVVRLFKDFLNITI